MTEDRADRGDQLEPGQSRTTVRDGVLDHQDSQQPLRKIARERNRGRAATQRPQDIRCAGAAAAVCGQVDVSVKAGDDHAGRNGPQEVSDNRGQDRLLPRAQGRLPVSLMPTTV